jgi:hypothetical protein
LYEASLIASCPELNEHSAQDLAEENGDVSRAIHELWTVLGDCQYVYGDDTLGIVEGGIRELLPI